MPARRKAKAGAAQAAEVGRGDRLAQEIDVGVDRLLVQILSAEVILRILVCPAEVRGKAPAGALIEVRSLPH